MQGLGLTLRCYQQSFYFAIITLSKVKWERSRYKGSGCNNIFFMRALLPVISQKVDVIVEGRLVCVCDEIDGKIFFFLM